MKTIVSLPNLLRALAFAGSLLAFLPQLRATPENDAAVQLLLQNGSVPVHHAGPYVETGTFRVQVLAKLGQPDMKVGDGIWLYHGRRIENTETVGTLVVRFEKGRVRSLSLATPAVVADLKERQHQPRPAEFAAVK